MDKTTILPDELIVHAFSYLSAKELGLSASVCKRWKRISEDEQLWKPFVVQQVGSSTLEGATFRSQASMLAPSRYKPLNPNEYGSAARSFAKWNAWTPLFKVLYGGGMVFGLGCGSLLLLTTAPLNLGAYVLSLGEKVVLFRGMRNALHAFSIGNQRLGLFCLILGGAVLFGADLGLQGVRRRSMPRSIATLGDLNKKRLQELVHPRVDLRQAAQWELLPKHLIEKALYLKSHPELSAEQRDAEFELARRTIRLS